MTAHLNWQYGAPLAPHTTIGLGGPARMLAVAESAADLLAAVAVAREEALPFLLLGGGSNVVLHDEGFAGLVVLNRLRGIEFGAPEDGGGTLPVRAAAGENWDQFVEACVRRGLAGAECMSGIPGLVGGTPVQNVGAYGQECSEIITSVSVIDLETLEQLELPASECQFAYRTSRFKHSERGRHLITAVDFRLRTDGRPSVRYAELERSLGETGAHAAVGPAALQRVREAVLAIRKGKSMVYAADDPDSHSCGSFFTNPTVTEELFADLQASEPAIVGHAQPEGRVKLSAAWLVEQAGFARGTRRGGVGVSNQHSLALVNYGGTSAELIALAREVRDAVVARFGIRLEPEPLLFDPLGQLIEL